MVGKRKIESLEEALERPFCYYCERDFDDNGVLVQHQRAKHYKCRICHKNLNTANGLCVHVANVHKETITEIQNTLPGRESTKLEIFGMLGVPEEFLQKKRQEIIDVFTKDAADKKRKTGNPPKGSAEAKAMGEKAKQPKVKETKEELHARLEAHKAKRRAEKFDREAKKLWEVPAEAPADNSGDGMVVDPSFSFTGVPGTTEVSMPLLSKDECAYLSTYWDQAPTLTTPTPFAPGAYGMPAPVYSPGPANYPPGHLGYAPPTTFPTQSGFGPPQTALPPTPMTFVPGQEIYGSTSAPPVASSFGYGPSAGAQAQAQSPFGHGSSPYPPPIGQASSMLPMMPPPYPPVGSGYPQLNGPPSSSPPLGGAQNPTKGPTAEPRKGSLPASHPLPDRPPIQAPNLPRQPFPKYRQPSTGGEYNKPNPNTNPPRGKFDNGPRNDSAPKINPSTVVAPDKVQQFIDQLIGGADKKKLPPSVPAGMMTGDATPVNVEKRTANPPAETMTNGPHFAVQEKAATVNVAERTANPPAESMTNEIRSAVKDEAPTVKVAERTRKKTRKLKYLDTSTSPEERRFQRAYPNGIVEATKSTLDQIGNESGRGVSGTVDDHHQQ